MAVTCLRHRGVCDPTEAEEKKKGCGHWTRHMRLASSFHQGGPYMLMWVVNSARKMECPDWPSTTYECSKNCVVVKPGSGSRRNRFTTRKCCARKRLHRRARE